MNPITVLIATLPFLPALNIIQGFDIPLVRIAALGWFAVWFIRRTLRRQSIIPTSGAVLAVSALVFISILSVLWAEVPEFALRKGFYFLTILPIAWIGATLTAKEKDAALRGLRIGATAAATFALTVFFGQFVFGAAFVEKGILTLAPFLFGGETAEAVASFPSWYVAINGGSILRAFLPFSSPQTASLFFGFGLAASLSKRNAAQSFLLIVALLATFSRGAFVVLAAMLLVWIFLIRQKEKQKRSTKNTALILAGTLLLAVFVPNILERAGAIFMTGEGSVAGRLLLWKDAILVAIQAPIFGVGLGGLAVALNPLAGYRIPINAHSMYLEFFAELGVVGAGALFWTLIATFRGFLSRQKEAFGQIGILSIVAYSVHAIFETNMYYPANLFILMLIIGISVVKKSEQPA